MVEKGKHFNNDSILLRSVKRKNEQTLQLLTKDLGHTEKHFRRKNPRVDETELKEKTEQVSMDVEATRNLLYG